MSTPTAPTLSAEAVMERMNGLFASGQLGEAVAQAQAQMVEKARDLGVDMSAPANPAAEESLDGYRDPGSDPAEEWAQTVAAAQALARAKAAHPAGKGRPIVCGNGDTAERFATGGTVEAPPAESIAEEALRVVNGDRAREYGAASENSLPRTAKMWSAYLGREVSGRDVANLMQLLKLAREAHAPKRDNHVDIVGYGLLAEQLPAE